MKNNIEYPKVVIEDKEFKLLWQGDPSNPPKIGHEINPTCRVISLRHKGMEYDIEYL